MRDWVGALHCQMQNMKLPVPVALTLVTRLADIEERLALGSGDYVQLHAIIAAFFEARHALHAPQIPTVAAASS